MKGFIVIPTLFFLLISTIVFTRASAFAADTSVGICHQVSGLGNPAVTWGYTTNEGNWAKIEPQRGVFNWTELDASIATAKQAGKKLWIQVLTDDPSGTIPQWALDTGMHQLPSDYNLNVYNKDKPVQWDPLYHTFLQEVLTAMAARYDNNDGNNDAIEAILMMSGGHYGEMALHGYNPIRTAYLSEMSRVTGISVSELEARQTTTWPAGTTTIPDINDPETLFDQKFTQNTFKLTDIYATTFRTKPVVLQLGTPSMGSGDSRYVAGNAAKYAVDTYGSHVWLKQNGLGNWGGSDYYNTLFSTFKGKTRTTREIGHLEYMCAKPFDVNGRNPASSTACVRTSTDDACTWNKATMDSSITAGISAICFQSNFFQTYSKDLFPCIDFATLKTSMADNPNPPVIPGGGGGGGTLAAPVCDPGKCCIDPKCPDPANPANPACANPKYKVINNCAPGYFPVTQYLGYDPIGCVCTEANADLRKLFELINGIMIPISIIGGIFLIVLAGYKILTSQGNPQELQTGKENLTSAIIGLIFVLMAVSILRVIIKALITGTADPF